MRLNGRPPPPFAGGPNPPVWTDALFIRDGRGLYTTRNRTHPESVLHLETITLVRGSAYRRLAANQRGHRHRVAALV